MAKKLIFDKPVITSATDIDTLVRDAKTILSYELAHYRAKVERGSNLDLKEARVITNYLDSLTKLQRAEIEASRSQDLSNLSTEEMIKLLKDLDARPSLPEPSND